MRHSKLRSALNSSNSVMFDMRPYKSMGEPVGDAFGGAAYSEKNSNLFSAITSVFAIVAAIPTGGASLTLLGGLAMAGGALGLIGNLTGNKTLSMLGGVMGMGAGLANAFSGNGIFASLGTKAADSSGTLSGAFDPFKAAQATSSIDPSSGVNAFLDGGAAGGAATSGLALGAEGNAFNEMASASKLGGMSNVNSSMLGNQQSSAWGGGGSVDGALPDVTSTPVPDAIVSSDLPNANSSYAPNSAKGVSSFTSPATTPTEQLYSTAPAGAQAASFTEPQGLLANMQSKGKDMMSFFKDNAEVTKIVGEFVKGTYQSPQEKAKAQSYVDYYNQQTAVSKQQQINAQAIPTMNMQVNPNTPVQFNTAIRRPVGMGLLNRSASV